MFYFCGLKFVAVPPYLYPCTLSAPKAASAGVCTTDEDLTLNLLVKGFRANMTHIQILPSGKAPAFLPVLDVTDVVPSVGTFFQIII
ncbi:hypothetical protein [Pseudorhizobium flavum]|uniref:hypothetical protein n=1 Tax=Pseudorhizobium flavum TaxID=1335061 RepID=UPI002490EC54|nr:hypothetical protein [Pseudorhizobium flavum]